jgi:hypothetical protein
MKKIYEAPEVCKIEFDVEEALMASVIPGSGTGTEIGGGAVDLW